MQVSSVDVRVSHTRDSVVYKVMYLALFPVHESLHEQMSVSHIFCCNVNEMVYVLNSYASCQMHQKFPE